MAELVGELFHREVASDKKKTVKKRNGRTEIVRARREGGRPVSPPVVALLRTVKWFPNHSRKEVFTRTHTKKKLKSKGDEKKNPIP